MSSNDTFKDSHLRVALDSITDFAFIINTKYEILYTNKAFCNLVALPIEDIVGKKCSNLLHGTESPWFECQVQKTIKTKSPVKWEVNDLFLGIPLLVTTSPLFDKNENLTAVVYIAKDISGVKANAKSLIENEECFYSVFYKSKDAMLIIDNNNFVDCNKTTIKMLEYKSKEDFLSTHPSILSPPIQPDKTKSFEKAEKMMQIALENGYHRFEWIHRKATGEDFPVEVSLTPITLKNKRVILCVWRDITDEYRKRFLNKTRIYLIEYSLQHTLNELLQKALDIVGEFLNSPLGFYHFIETDQKTISLQQWSTATLNKFCKTEGHGMHCDIKDAGVWVDCVYKKKPVIHNDYKSLRHKKGMPEGHAKVVRELVVPVLRNNKVVAILGIGNKPSNYTKKDSDIVSFYADVTWEIVQKKIAIEERRQVEKKFADIARFTDENPYPVFRVSKEGRLIYKNNACYDLILKKNIAKGSFISAYWHKEVKDVLQSQKAKYIESVINKSIFSFNIVPVIEKGYVNIYGKDITEQKKAEQAIIATQRIQATGTLASGMAHEFNNILGIISGYTEILGDTLDLTSKQSELFSKISKQVELGTHIISNIQKFTDQSKKYYELINLSDLIANTVGIIGLTVPINITISLDLDNTVPLIFGNSSELQQVLLNLCNNSIQSMEGKGGNLIISLKFSDIKSFNKEDLAGRLIKLCVTDTGCGIDPDIVNQIFDPFFTTKEPGKGTGLGLSIVHGIISAHKGKLTVNSTPNIGTSICAILPAAKDIEDKAVHCITKIKKKGTEHIFIVDDNIDYLNMLKVSLTNLGYAVSASTKASEALDIIKKKHMNIDLIISDYAMPELSGIELFEKIKMLKGSSVPFILITGYIDTKLNQIAKNNEKLEVFSKPVGLNKLSNAIRSLLDN